MIKAGKSGKNINAGLKNIILLGIVSFFADASSEMVYPIIPLYLTVVLGATPALVGVIEGVAESLASLLKVYSGYISDRYQRKKPLAFSGYVTGVLYKLALIFAGSWVGILTARIIDRFGKGIRTAPRDVMVADSAEGNKMGRAFGIHKTLDKAGSAVGILLAFLLLSSAGTINYKMIFAFSIIPVVLALFMFLFIKEKTAERNMRPREKFWHNIGRLDGRLKLYLFVAFLFTLGNSSNTFLLLRAKDLDFSDTNTILLYLLYNVMASLFAIPFGRLSDKIGRKRLLVGGYILFSVVYFGFAFATSKATIIIVFALYGIYTAMTSGVERAFIAEIAPKELKGTMLGLLATLVGIALLPASMIAGLLWDTLGAPAPFIYGASLSALAAVLLLVFLKTGEKQKI